MRRVGCSRLYLIMVSGGGWWGRIMRERECGAVWTRLSRGCSSSRAPPSAPPSCRLAGTEKQSSAAISAASFAIRVEWSRPTRPSAAQRVAAVT